MNEIGVKSQVYKFEWVISLKNVLFTLSWPWLNDGEKIWNYILFPTLRRKVYSTSLFLEIPYNLNFVLQSKYAFVLSLLYWNTK